MSAFLKQFELGVGLGKLGHPWVLVALLSWWCVACAPSYPEVSVAVVPEVKAGRHGEGMIVVTIAKRGPGPMSYYADKWDSLAVHVKPEEFDSTAL